MADLNEEGEEDDEDEEDEDDEGKASVWRQAVEASKSRRCCEDVGSSEERRGKRESGVVYIDSTDPAGWNDKQRRYSLVTEEL